jgi:tRNA(adenine34) deaminase
MSNLHMETDLTYMQRCIELAKLAKQRGDTPVGSLVLRDGKILGEGTEEVKARLDPTAHAEIQAIREACRNVASLDLSGSILYTTAEPCWMCSYAIRRTRISGVVIGVLIASAGGVSSPYPILTQEIASWAPPPSITSGVLKAECEELRA